MDQITKALADHRDWKLRLRQAIEEGAGNLSPSAIRTANFCEFGRWLQSDLPPELTSLPEYREVCRLHVEFHRAAADVLVIEHSGQQDAAMAAMSATSAYGRTSNELAAAMISWKTALLRAGTPIPSAP